MWDKGELQRFRMLSDRCPTQEATGTNRQAYASCGRHHHLLSLMPGLLQQNHLYPKPAEKAENRGGSLRPEAHALFDILTKSLAKKQKTGKTLIINVLSFSLLTNPSKILSQTH